MNSLRRTEANEQRIQLMGSRPMEVPQHAFLSATDVARKQATLAAAAAAAAAATCTTATYSLQPISRGSNNIYKHTGTVGGYTSVRVYQYR